MKLLKEIKPLDFNSTSILKSLFTFICLFIIWMILYAFANAITNNSAYTFMVVYISITIINIIFNHKKLIKELKSIKEDTKDKLPNVILVTIIFLVLEYITNLILIKILGHTPMNNDLIIKNIESKYIIIYIIDLLIIGPISEELLYLYPFNNCTNKKLAFIIYVILFALSHMSSFYSIKDLIFIIPYIFMSISFNYGYYKTNNIYVSIIIHALNNLLSLVILFI